LHFIFFTIPLQTFGQPGTGGDALHTTDTAGWINGTHISEILIRMIGMNRAGLNTGGILTLVADSHENIIRPICPGILLYLDSGKGHGCDTVVSQGTG
jgi:hypothetical protein